MLKQPSDSCEKLAGYLLIGFFFSIPEALYDLLVIFIIGVKAQSKP